MFRSFVLVFIACAYWQEVSCIIVHRGSHVWSTLDRSSFSRSQANFLNALAQQRKKGRRSTCGWEGVPFPPDVNSTTINRRPVALQKHVHTTCEQLIQTGRRNICETYTRAYTNTIDSTVEVQARQMGDGVHTTFVKTGDISDMWLRDSAAQINHYISLLNDDTTLKDMVTGLLRLQMDFYMANPYANSFRSDGSVATNNFELDSVCYAIKLGHRLWKETGDSSVFGGSTFLAFVDKVVEQWTNEQNHPVTSKYGPEEAPQARDVMGPVKPNTGLIWQAYRPSDDVCEYHYNIPGNMMASVALGMIEEALADVFSEDSRSDRTRKVRRLRADIDKGIHEFGRGRAPGTGAEVYAYEVDGLGNQSFMDDANIPSLLSIPYIGYTSPFHDTSALYEKTREFVLSKNNPYFFEGAFASGVGSPHTSPGCIWPLGLIMQGLTASSLTEKRRVLRVLENTTGGTGYMHESFLADDPSTYTRGWFGWAASLYAEFVEQILLIERSAI